MWRPLLLVPVLMILAGAPPGNPGDDKGGRLPFDELVKGRETVHVRENGAKLTIANAVISGEGHDRVFTVEWSIDYTGPRPPFTVVTPTLDHPTSPQAQLYFMWKDGAGRAVPFTVRQWILGPGRPGLPKYVTSSNGKPVTGKTVVTLRWIEEVANREFTARDTLYVQLLHEATDRGQKGDGKNDLDAWTGTLWSNPIQVKFLD